MKIYFKDKEYTFLVGYQKENHYRTEFNNLAEKVFGISFEPWFQAGYWNEKYRPYTLFDDGKAIANVSVNIMDFDELGKRKHYVQIGTVMTHPNYRNKGLNGFLMEKVLDEWDGKGSVIYLYANPSVLDFYPKFGFKRVKEYSCLKSIQNKSGHINTEKLNMNQQSDRDRLYNLASHSETFAKLSMKDNADLVMFYCNFILKEHIHYIPLLSIIAVATHKENQLQVWDIFGESDVELDKIIYFLAAPQTNEVLLGFTPKDIDSYTIQEIKGDDVLFIQDGKTNLFDENKLMFPLLSHA